MTILCPPGNPKQTVHFDPLYTFADGEWTPWASWTNTMDLGIVVAKNRSRHCSEHLHGGIQTCSEPGTTEEQKGTEGS